MNQAKAKNMSHPENFERMSKKKDPSNGMLEK